MAETTVCPDTRNWCWTTRPVAAAVPSPKFQVTVGVSPSASVTLAVKVTTWYLTGETPAGVVWAMLIVGAWFTSTSMVRSAIFWPFRRPSSAVNLTI